MEGDLSINWFCSGNTVKRKIVILKLDHTLQTRHFENSQFRCLQYFQDIIFLVLFSLT